MVFSAVGYTSSTTGTAPRNAPEEHHGAKIDPAGGPDALRAKVADKSDITAYVLNNTPIIGMAGVAAGLQAAYYNFERMPPSVSRPALSQASTLYGIVAKKSLFAAGLGALFCTTEALVEQYRGKHDSTSGVVAGLVTGAAFGITRPWPQIVAWPLTFAVTALAADFISETMPNAMKGFRYYGPLEHRPTWSDPAPPRPPILDTGASARPAEAGSFWRGG